MILTQNCFYVKVFSLVFHCFDTCPYFGCLGKMCSLLFLVTYSTSCVVFLYCRSVRQASCLDFILNA